MNIRLTLFLISIFGLLSNCTSEPSTQSDPIDEELQEYIERFAEEAELRNMNIEIDSDNFTAQIGVITDRGTVGQCRIYSDGRQEVVIHSPYWSNIEDIDREYLVFHELGHCILGRDHNDESDNQGNCISIMQNGDDTCEKIYHTQNRRRLIDELFFN